MRSFSALLALCLLCTITTTSLAQLSWTGLPDSLHLGELQLGTEKVVELSVRNTSSQTVTLNAPSFHDSYAYQSLVVECLPADSRTLAPQESLTYSVRMRARHNMLLRGWLSFSMVADCKEIRKDICLWGSGLSNDYDYCFNREYSELYDSLHTHVDKHTVLTYKPAREMMFGKADNVNGIVECIYTGKTLATVGIPPNGEFNTEHTWVQSRGSSSEPNKSDVNHLYPTNPNANSIRANYPFGFVSKVWKDVGGGSRLGFTQRGDTVFEPRDVSKGNIARSIFYYLVRYGNVTGYYTSPYAMDSTLRLWNASDPPDARELLRCDTIARYQGKRNPFVDHPEFAERMDFVPTQHSNLLHTLQQQLVYDPTADSTELECTLVNVSNNSLRITELSSDAPSLVSFSSTDTTSPLAPHSARALHIRYRRSDTSTSSIRVVLKAGAENTQTVVLTGCALTSVHDSPSLTNSELCSVWPQPFHDWCTVDLGSAALKPRSVALYSLRSELLTTLSDQITSVNNHYQLRFTGAQCMDERVVLLRVCYDNQVLSRLIVRD